MFKKKIVTLALMLACSCMVISVFAAKKKKGTDCGAKLHQAIDKFNKHHYYSAKSLLDETMLDCGGSDNYDSMLYYAGQSAYCMKKYDDAKLNFENLTQKYSQAPWNEEALFRIGACNYFLSNPPERDQAGTKEAITALTTFIETFPSGVFADSARAYILKCREKLAKKEFNAARFYETIGQYEAAIVYHKNFIQSFPESQLIGETKFNMAADLIKLNRLEEAKTALNDLLAAQPSKEINDKAAALLNKIEKQ
ncbi:MAG: outer membrane protein assembly factor BamD [Chitinivibrionales bacterium]|nr:outer membrane protein assembly factor BamD [Chitinivibrionales bacterium]